MRKRTILYILPAICLACSGEKQFTESIQGTWYLNDFDKAAMLNTLQNKTDDYGEGGWDVSHQPANQENFSEGRVKTEDDQYHDDFSEILL